MALVVSLGGLERRAEKRAGWRRSKIWKENARHGVSACCAAACQCLLVLMYHHFCFISLLPLQFKITCLRSRTRSSFSLLSFPSFHLTPSLPSYIIPCRFTTACPFFVCWYKCICYFTPPLLISLGPRSPPVKGWRTCREGMLRNKKRKEARRRKEGVRGRRERRRPQNDNKRKKAWQQQSYRPSTHTPSIAPPRL